MIGMIKGIREEIKSLDGNQKELLGRLSALEHTAKHKLRQNEAKNRAGNGKRDTHKHA